MTERLKTMMDRAADRDFAAVDLDAITSAGDRTVRRRRVASGIAGIAALAAVATTAMLASGDGDGKADFVDTPFRTDVPMWTEGSTLHTPEHTYDLGIAVVTIVRTSHGVVFVGENHGVYRFSGSDPVRIGTATPRDDDLLSVVGDAEGSLVGWVDGSGAKPAFVVHDLASGEEQRFDEHTDPAMKRAELPEAALFLGVDDRTMYWLDRRGTVAVDVDTGDVRVLGGPDQPVYILDANAGLTVNWVESESGGDLGSEVVDSEGHVVLGWRKAGTVGALSPDGRWVAGLDTPSVVEVATGERHRLETGHAGDAVGYDWLDDDTLLAFTELDDDQAIGLLRCEVTAGTCIDVATVSLAQRVALPSFGLLSSLYFGGGEDSGSAQNESSSEVTETVTVDPE